MGFEHKSVLLWETIDGLNIKPDGIYVDGTLGGAGHSLEIVKKLGDGGRHIGIDQDAAAIAAATEKLKPYEEKVTIVRSNYSAMKEIHGRIAQENFPARREKVEMRHDKKTGLFRN